MLGRVQGNQSVRRDRRGSAETLICAALLLEFGFQFCLVGRQVGVHGVLHGLLLLDVQRRHFLPECSAFFVILFVDFDFEPVEQKLFERVGPSQKMLVVRNRRASVRKFPQLGLRIRSGKSHRMRHLLVSI